MTQYLLLSIISIIIMINTNISSTMLYSRIILYTEPHSKKWIVLALPCQVIWQTNRVFTRISVWKCGIPPLFIIFFVGGGGYEIESHSFMGLWNYLSNQHPLPRRKAFSALPPPLPTGWGLVQYIAIYITKLPWTNHMIIVSWIINKNIIQNK